MSKLTKEERYEANVRNGFYMWHFNSSINTVKNILEAKEGKLYVPLYEEVRLRPCPKPPLKSFVIKAVLDELEKKELWRVDLLEQVENGTLEVSQEEFQFLQRVYRLNITHTHQPDIEWLLNVLSTLNPDHRFFHRSYYPSDEELGGRGAKSKNLPVEEEDPFLAGLPEHISKKKMQQSKRESSNDQQSKKSSSNNAQAKDAEILRLSKFILQMQQNANGSNEEAFSQNNIQSSQANGQIQQPKNVISHQQMNIGIQSFSQQHNLTNSLQPINLFGTTKLGNIFALPGNNPNRFMAPAQNFGSQFDFRQKIKPDAVKTLSQRILEEKLQGSKTLINKSVFEDSDALQQQETFQVSADIYQTGITQQFYAQENGTFQAEEPGQTTAGSNQKTAFKVTQPNSSQVTPTKIQMKTFQIQYKITNSGLKIDQLPQDGTSRRYPAIKNSNTKMHSVTDFGNGSQMDFQSVDRQ